MKLAKQWRAARARGVPLVAIETADPAATMVTIATNTVSYEDRIWLEWNIVSGMRGKNKLAETWIKETTAKLEMDWGMATSSPSESLRIIGLYAKPGTIIYMHNAHRFIENESVAQAIWNLRDIFKMHKPPSTLVMLCPFIRLPFELRYDVMVFSETLPSITEIGKIADGIWKDAGMEGEIKDRDRIIDALCGLPTYSAETTLAMAMKKDGIDREMLWDRKVKAIEQTRGLSVWNGEESFKNIGGYDNVKFFLSALFKGVSPPRVVVFIDEIEKHFAGFAGDTSGVTQSLTGTMLSYMQDKEVMGMIFIGPAGCAKSAIAKAAGNENERPTIVLDFSGLKGSFVGESEGNLRNALRVIDAVGQNQALFIATCNSIGALPPELRRRFNLGIFFFSLPTPKERELIWSIYLKRWEIKEDGQRGFDDTGWTGAEIKQCCLIAYRLGITLDQAAKFIVPVSVSAKSVVDRLMEQADGNFVDAGRTGLFKRQYYIDLENDSKLEKFNKAQV